eukprot:4689411-Pyramimonas_sp.AAC.2
MARGPQGTPPTAQLAAFARVRGTQFGTPLTRFVAFRGPNGHETCEGCTELGSADACERGQWSIRSLRATSHVRGVPKWVPRPHANAATGAFGGAPEGPRTI